jgi:WD40 repeat protein
MPLRSTGVRAMAALPDGGLVSAAADEDIRLWDEGTGELVRTFGSSAAGCGPVLSLTALGPLDDGASASGTCGGPALFASGCEGGTVLLWDRRAARCVQRLSGHVGPVGALCAIPSQHRLASGSTGEVKLWELRAPDARRGRSSGRGSASAAGPARFAKTLSRHSARALHTAAVTSLAAFPDGSFVSGALDGSVRVWGRSGCSGATCVGHAGGVLAVVAVGAVAGSLPRYGREWLEGHQQRRRLPEVDGGLSGGIVASAGLDQEVLLWDSKTGREFGRLVGHGSEILALATLPGGAIASAGQDALILLWDPLTLRCTQRLVGHSAAVNVLAVLAGGRGLASGGADGTIKFW